jgi:hypothetical protein
VAAADALELDAPAAGVLDVEELDDDELDEHPAIIAAVAATATTPAAMRVCSNLDNMVLTAPFEAPRADPRRSSLG